MKALLISDGSFVMHGEINVLKFKGCTESGMLDKLNGQTIPVFWDDCEDTAVLEKVVTHVYNRVSLKP